ncbi:hypothetical protein [Mycobacteroides abscessus]|uniref:hypothetical protein n=1 Tax=Mycobacteroides abscessus TaxID=36809 RepID=UPI0005DD074E|nr:hypothetical protein [Mycobacteroides abscessus]CPW71627.1 Uncharacterised protein [Mycobacteroides abscessus]SKF62122.1 Uncharacterised protein [Mycobacteroides abscessus subsp. bolletii]SKH91623.1 Uncharacterised protein [Mycobacteroides abscessus subsp. bolletii]
MAPTNASVSIKDRDRFQQMLAKLTAIHAEIDAKASEGKNVTAALQVEASKGVTSSGTTTTTLVAPAYAQTLTTVEATVTKADAQIGAAKTSLGNVISDLQSLFSGLSAIDSQGAQKVKEA